VSDLLVPLLKLPALEPLVARLAMMGVTVRRARSYEKSQVRRFVLSHFSEGWGDETDVSFTHQPIGCHLATSEGRVAGFAVVESTARGFFGPTGVDPAHRGKGIGTALLVAALYGLRDLGYVYAVIGWAGPVDFYVRTVHATPIEDSEPSVYSDLLSSPQSARPR
jgi:GNAT superfamily N-acetyltransferase